MTVKDGSGGEGALPVHAFSHNAPMYLSPSGHVKVPCP